MIEAAVVRQKDAQWGEVRLHSLRAKMILDASAVFDMLEDKIARYKRPKAIYFIPEAEFPRSTTGKIKRHLLRNVCARAV